MANGPTVLCISGTSRPDNYTHRALAVVCDELRRRGMSVVTFDARETTLSFPGHPETEDARRLKEQVAAASAIVLATPEYHGTFCAMTKLIIENLGFPSSLKGKAVALLGVAAGRIGAIKSLEHLRGTLAHTGALVVPQAVSIAGVRSAFDGENIIDDGAEKALRSIADSLQQFMKAYVCPARILEEYAREGGQEIWTTLV